MRATTWLWWLGVGGCLAAYDPPATGGWAHELVFLWEPAEPTRPDDVGQAWRWTVPDGVTRIAVTAWGAGGGGSLTRPDERAGDGYAGGAGGLVVAELDVVPGETLIVVPGRGGPAGGHEGLGAWTRVPERPGAGGAGAPISGVDLVPIADRPTRPFFSCAPLDPTAPVQCMGAGAGGGASLVARGERLDEVAPDTTLVVAGGGGGGGAGGPGGAGGGRLAEDAPPCGTEGTSVPGAGARDDAPGVLGVRAITLDDAVRLGGHGAALAGGSGGYASPHLGLGLRGSGNLGGGGGGGGWFGGSGSASTLPNAPACGGGGGSGHAVGSHVQSTTGTAPEVPDDDGRIHGTAGAPGGDGGHGAVRIQW